MFRAILLASLTLAPAAALAGVPEVVTDIPPVHSLVSMVMGNLGTPGLLLDDGADAHDYQLRPSQGAALERADLLIWVGPAMTPWLDRIAAGRDSGSVLGLLDLPQTRLLGFGSGEADHDHAHSPGDADPHAWLDAGNAAIWLTAIADDLGRRDPENAAIYRANAAAARERLVSLDGSLRQRLQAAQGRPIVTGHDAYGYFARRYGLTIAGTVAAGDAVSPGAARLTALRATIRQSGVACLFPELGQPEAATVVLAEGTAVRIGTPLDPEGRSLLPGPDLYPALLTGLAEAIADCVAGGQG
jgi:zinc transport system substrate-binding protein